MEIRNEKLGKGLRKMYLGNIAAIISMLSALLCLLVPPLMLLVLIALLVSAVVSLIGLVDIRNEHPDYQSALVAVVVGFVCNLFSRGDSMFATLLGICGSLASLCMTYFVIRATNRFLEQGGLEELVEQGRQAWKWSWISTAGTAATTLGGLLLSLINGYLAIAVGSVALIGFLIISIYALVLYLGYLDKSSRAVS